MEPSAYVKMSDVERTHWWYVARRHLLDGVLSTLGLPPNSRLLEVGCGTGGNLELLGRYGRVSAIEMDANARSIAAKAPGAENTTICAGHLPDSNSFSDGAFDGIFLFDVLEHIKPDFEALQELRRCLRPDGRIVITVPAYQWLWGRHDEVLHHHRRYTKRRLTVLLQQTGYDVRKISYFNTFLFPLVAMARVWEKFSHNGEIAGQSMPRKSINTVLKSIFSSEKPLLLRTGMPFGVSLLCVASPKTDWAAQSKDAA